MQKKVLKGTRWLLLKAAEHLDEERDEKKRLKEALALNQSLAVAYYLKEDLRQFWEQSGKKFVSLFLDGWIKRAEGSGIEKLQEMAKTLASHRSSLLAYYDALITSGPMEGTNNKIKTMKRQTYGFRDREFFKLKILAIHESQHKFVGLIYCHGLVESAHFRRMSQNSLSRVSNTAQVLDLPNETLDTRRLSRLSSSGEVPQTVKSLHRAPAAIESKEHALVG